jgi:hypothetical protein
LFLIAGCSLSPCEQIEGEFRRNNPDLEVVSIIPEEGDKDNFYVCIEYKKAGSDTVYIEVWLYQKEAGYWLPTKRVKK